MILCRNVLDEGIMLSSHHIDDFECLMGRTDTEQQKKNNQVSLFGILATKMSK